MTARPTAPNPPQTAAKQSLGAMPCCALRVLRLTLKRKWFDMIASGEKKEEYREIKNWIISRLHGKTYDSVEFSNGYGAHVPKVTVEYLGWGTGTGRAKWGATPGKPTIIIRLGAILSRLNDEMTSPHKTKGNDDE
jgi:hypothetical protein